MSWLWQWIKRLWTCDHNWEVVDCDMDCTLERCSKCGSERYQSIGDEHEYTTSPDRRSSLLLIVSQVQLMMRLIVSSTLRLFERCFCSSAHSFIGLNLACILPFSCQ